MTVAFPEDPPETEPEANPMHEGPDADVTDIDSRPHLEVHDEDDGGSTSFDDYVQGELRKGMDDAIDREFDGGGGNLRGIVSTSTLTLVYATRDGQEVRLDLDQEAVGAEDFETALEAFERTVRYLVAEQAVRRDEE